MRKINLKIWEKLLIVLATAGFAVSLYLYFINYPILKSYLRVGEESGRVVIGHLVLKRGSVKRQPGGKGAFEETENLVPIYSQDVIVTGEGAEADISLENGGSAQIAENTMVRLAFFNELAIGGINRVGNFEVVSGKVVGQAGKQKILVRTKNQVVEVKPNSVQGLFVSLPVKPELNAAPAVQVLTPKPIPIPAYTPPSQSLAKLDDIKVAETPVVTKALATPSPLPSPTPIPTVASVPRPSPKPSESFKLLSTPLSEEVGIDKSGKMAVKKMRLSWKMKQPNGAMVVKIFKVEKGKQKETRGEEILNQPLIVNKGQVSLAWVSPSPGEYQWEVADANKTPLRSAKGRLFVKPEFKDIVPLAPLVGGRSSLSNKLSGDLLTDFEIRLRWDPYPGAKEYKVRFESKPNSSTALLEKKLETTEYIFNKKKILAGEVYYKVFALLENGYLAFSDPHKFAFTFLPPALVLPENNLKMTKQDLVKEGNRILFTWQKTNFTKSYEIEIAQDAAFAKTLLKRSSKENFFLLKDPPPGSYWWRVRSIAEATTSPMGSPNSFIIAP